MSLRGNVHVRDTLVCSSMLRHISNYVHITCLTRYSTRTHTHTRPHRKKETRSKGKTSDISVLNAIKITQSCEYIGVSVANHSDKLGIFGF